MSAPAKASTGTVIRTFRFKVRVESYAWLAAAAIEVNRVWNYCNETSYKAARPFSGPTRWLSGYDLCNLSSGATEYFGHIGADTIQKTCCEFAVRRRQFRKTKLRWRVSNGSRRSLGWIPFKAASIRWKGQAIRFCGKTFRVFERQRLAEIRRFHDGWFNQDSVGDWWLNLAVEVEIGKTAAPKAEVGIDLGLRDTAVTSDGERLEAGRAYRMLEPRIAAAQRRGHKRKAKRLHRTAARRRADALHKFSRRITNTYQMIVIGDVRGVKLAQTRFAKAVLDTGWGLLRTQLQYKGQEAGRSVKVVDERNTSRTCSACGALAGPTGVNGLRVRLWVCAACGITQDRDVNAAKNILAAGRCPPSVERERAIASARAPKAGIPPARGRDHALRRRGLSTGAGSPRSTARRSRRSRPPSA